MDCDGTQSFAKLLCSNAKVLGEIAEVLWSSQKIVCECKSIAIITQKYFAKRQKCCVRMQKKSILQSYQVKNVAKENLYISVSSVCVKHWPKSP